MIHSVKKVKLPQFAFSEGVILTVSNAVIFLGFLQIFLPGPPIFIKFSYTIICVWKMTGFIQFKSTFQVFRITLRTLAKDIGKIAFCQIVTKGDCTFIPIHRLLDILLNANTIFKEAANIIYEVGVI